MGLANMGIGGIPGGSSLHSYHRRTVPESTVKPPVEDDAAEFKNKQINELSDMVKILLEEQRALKEKLE
jgi:hypothetical protein